MCSSGWVIQCAAVYNSRINRLEFVDSPIYHVRIYLLDDVIWQE